MLKNIVRPKREKIVRHEVVFMYDRNSGFGFPCNKTGELLKDEISERGLKNYQECLSHPERFAVYNEIQTYTHYYTPNAHGTCVCGARVELHNQYMGACECAECGRWYNLNGQSLLPPNQWRDTDYDY